AMARGGAPIEPAWDRFLVCAFHHETSTFVECVMVVPAARCEAAAAAAVRGAGQFDMKVRSALALLEVFDAADVARAALELLHRPVHESTFLAALRGLASSRPAVARALAEHEKRLPTPVPLSVLARSRVVDDLALGPTHRAQLVELRESDPDTFDEAAL